MNKTKIIKISICLMLILFFGCILLQNSKNVKKEIQDSNFNEEISAENHYNESIVNEELKQILPGIKTSSLEILDNPLRISGNIYIPEKNIQIILSNFLKETNNELISDLNVKLDDNMIEISAKYKILGLLNVFISASVEPSIDTTGDIKLSIKRINVSKININNKIIASVVEAWIKDEEMIKAHGNNILIDKNMLNNIKISNITIENQNIHCSIELHL